LAGKTLEIKRLVSERLESGRSVLRYIVALLVVGGPLLAQSALPPGVVRVLFGAARRTTDTAGTETCRVVDPLPNPAAFPRGATEITYAVELKPGVVKKAAAQMIPPTGQGALTAVPCNVFTLVPRGFSQTQIGNTVSRADGKPLAAGSYKVRIIVDGQTLDVPFTVK
jgi:hypothetical protein